MQFSEYVEFVEPERKKPTLFFRIWYRLKTMRDTINHDKSVKEFEQMRQETMKNIRSINIVGMELEEARKKVPKITIRNYGIYKTEAYCCGRCNVYVDENNIITEIIDFG